VTGGAGVAMAVEVDVGAAPGVEGGALGAVGLAEGGLGASANARESGLAAIARSVTAAA